MGQTTRTLVRAAVVTSATFGMVLAGGVAQAAVHQHGDARGDTSSRELSRSATSARAAQPVGVMGDITSLLVAHQYETVDVMVEMDDLVPAGDAVAVRVRLRTPSGTWVARVADKQRDGVFTRTTRMRVAGGGPVACTGLSGSLDYDLDTATVRVPRLCLGGDPAWVRVGATSRLRDGNRVQLDDAQRNGTAPRRTALSPRVVA